MRERERKTRTPATPRPPPKKLPNNNTKTTGFTLSMFFYYLFNKIAPPPGLGLGERKHDEDTLILPSAYRQDVPTQGRFSCVLDGEAVSMSGRSSEREKDGDEGGGEKKVSAVVHAF